MKINRRLGRHGLWKGSYVVVSKGTRLRDDLQAPFLTFDTFKVRCCAFSALGRINADTSGVFTRATYGALWGFRAVMLVSLPP
jgi:hypothetical protein